MNKWLSLIEAVKGMEEILLLGVTHTPLIVIGDLDALLSVACVCSIGRLHKINSMHSFKYNSLFFILVHVLVLLKANLAIYFSIYMDVI